MVFTLQDIFLNMRLPHPCLFHIRLFFAGNKKQQKAKPLLQLRSYLSGGGSFNGHWLHARLPRGRSDRKGRCFVIVDLVAHNPTCSDCAVWKGHRRYFVRCRCLAAVQSFVNYLRN